MTCRSCSSAPHPGYVYCQPHRLQRAGGIPLPDHEPHVAITTRGVDADLAEHAELEVIFDQVRRRTARVRLHHRQAPWELNS